MLYFLNLSQIHEEFWKKAPLLLVAFLFLATYIDFYFSSFPYLSLGLSFYLAFSRKKILILLLPLIFLHCSLFYHEPSSKENCLALFSTSSIQSHSSFFSKSYLYKGTLYLKEGKIPCLIKTKELQKGSKFFLLGDLKKKERFNYSFTPKEWLEEKKGPSIANFRYECKKKYENFLKKQFLINPKIADLLLALTTGEIENKWLRYQFQRTGLEHLLGVSGYHFTLVLSLFSFSITLFLHPIYRAIFLLLITTSYYLFIGPSPAVERCFFMTIGYLIAKLFSRKISPLNLLGAAMTIELFLDPWIFMNIGFQLSFASCIAITLFSRPFEHFLSYFFPQRELKEILLFSFFEKHLLLLIFYLKKALSITFAVNLTIAPLLFFHFHQVPLLSLFYNLFYPFLCDLGLLFFLFSSVIYLFSPLIAKLFFSILTSYLETLLNLCNYPPPLLDIPIIVPHFPPYLLAFLYFLQIVFAVSIYKSRTKERFSLTNHKLL